MQNRWNGYSKLLIGVALPTADKSVTSVGVFPGGIECSSGIVLQDGVHGWK